MGRFLSAIAAAVAAAVGAVVLFRLANLPTAPGDVMPWWRELSRVSQYSPERMLVSVAAGIGIFACAAMIGWALRTMWEVTVGAVARSVKERGDTAKKVRAAKAQKQREERKARRQQAKMAKDEQRSVTITTRDK